MSNDTALFLVLREIKVSNQEVRILSDVEFVSNILWQLFKLMQHVGCSRNLYLQFFIASIIHVIDRVAHALVC